MNFLFPIVENQELSKVGGHDIQLFVKRLDLIHPEISGNKYWKLKYNLQEAIKEGFDTILTFGGAFSNHIAAVAAAGKEFKFNTIGVIRGEELADKIQDNPTLSFARDCAMQLHFVSRKDYRDRSSQNFINQLRVIFGDFYLIPEGGTNELAVKGCEEILTDQDKEFEFICCSVGTGGTISGIINSSKASQQILGFPALKGDFLEDEIRKYTEKDNWTLIPTYHFGGYAKINEELVAFINEFKNTNDISLDPVYNGKMMYGIMDLIRKGYFPDGSKILAIHSGGLQGIQGMNDYLRKKQLPLIE